MPRQRSCDSPVCNYYNLTYLKYSKDDDEEEEPHVFIIHLNDGNPIRLSGVYSVGFNCDDVLSSALRYGVGWGH